MKRPICAVLLAGRIRPTPLSEHLGVPVICLPVCARGSLLSLWHDALASLANVQRIQVVVNTLDEVHAVKSIAARAGYMSLLGSRLQVVAEPAAWRGAAGIVHDVIRNLHHDNDDAIVLVCEAKRLPPPTLDPLIQPMLPGTLREHSAAGVIGICGDDEPAGVYAFAQHAIGHIPDVGYFDLKEQFLPTLRKHNQTLLAARVAQSTWRIHDRDSYIASVREALRTRTGFAIYVSEGASVAPSAILEGTCLIEAGAVIEEGALVHDSVVLWGATVGPRAVVSRSVVGSLSNVPANARLLGVIRADQQRRSDLIISGDLPEVAAHA